MDKLYKSISVRIHLFFGFRSLSLFSQVEDALSELDKYTQGYVDDYLFDGKEMMKEAKESNQKWLMIKNL